jgi:hypothetical protein
VRCGLVEYVEAKVNKGCLTQQIRNKVRPLLQDATDFNMRWKTECHDSVPSIKMVTCLLDRGADPNFLLPDVRTTEAKALCDSYPILTKPQPQVDLSLPPPTSGPENIISVESSKDSNARVPVLKVTKSDMPPPTVWGQTLLHVYENYDRTTIQAP